MAEGLSGSRPGGVGGPPGPEAWGQQRPARAGVAGEGPEIGEWVAAPWAHEKPHSPCPSRKPFRVPSENLLGN